MVYCLPGNGMSKYARHRTMPRTGSPATRHVAAVERAVAVLDVLAEAASSGRTRSRGATGSTRAPRRGCSRRSPAGGSSSTCPETGRYRLGLRLVRARATRSLARLDVRELARPQLQRARRTRRARPRRSRCPASTTRSRSTSSRARRRCRASPGSGGRASRTRPRPARSCSPSASRLPAGPLRAYTARTITDRERPRGARSSRVREQRLRGGARRARGRPERDRRAGARQ